MTWDSLQNILPKVAGKFNFKKTLDAIEVCQEYRNQAQKILPAESLKSTFPKSYENETLTIGVLNSAWAQQLLMHKHRIQQGINKKFGENTVKNVRIEMNQNLPNTSI